MDVLREWAKKVSRAEIAFYLIPVLILLLLVGTIAQKYIGLYAAHKMFFGSFVFFVGPIPLPGGYFILSLITASLFIRFIFFSEWRWRKAGIHLAHLGVLVLLAGGILTAATAQERYMIVPEGAETGYIYDYVKRELIVFRGEGDAREVQKIGFEDIADINALDVPFSIDVIEVCEHCEIEKREESTQEFDRPLQSMAQFMALTPGVSALDPEENINGFTFVVRGAGEQDGVYIAFEGMPKPIEIEDYRIILGKAQSELPFRIALDRFKKENYPGTDNAKNYISDIVVKDGGVVWPSRIEMNVPLRYRGYTFFQSSFEQTEDGALSVFSVVRNEGWLFPYIGTIIIMVGLIFHLIVVMRRVGP